MKQYISFEKPKNNNYFTIDSLKSVDGLYQQDLLRHSYCFADLQSALDFIEDVDATEITSPASLTWGKYKSSRFIVARKSTYPKGIMLTKDVSPNDDQTPFTGFD